MSQPDPSPSTPTTTPQPKAPPPLSTNTTTGTSITTTTTRRVPPPCWTHDETMALIEAYHEKWYSLRRGNLKASHWQDVADSVARRCSHLPSKTSVQCRHKIEKLRKRYRSEKQRAAHNHHRSFVSNWVFFKKMDNMERGPGNEDDDDEDEDDDDDEEEDGDGDENQIGLKNLHQQQHQQQHHRHVMSNGGGFRFRIPSTGQRSAVVFNSGSSAASKPKSFVNPNSSPNPNLNARVLNSGGSWARSVGGAGAGVGSSSSKREMEEDPVAEMVSSIRLLGEGFVRMEQMKIEMAREMEQMRMEMEMKRTQMILESQQRIVEAFAKGFSPRRKKPKRMIPSSPPEES